MIGVMYGEPWNCPEPPPEPRITFKVDLGPPVDLRARSPELFVFVEETPRQGWWDRFKGFMLALSEGTDP